MIYTRPIAAEDIDLARLMSHVKFHEGCWEWIGAKGKGGYGSFSVKGGTRLAHRCMYTKLVGPIPWDKELDHLCHNTWCVNPAHLEPVDHGENVFRGKIGQRAAWRRNEEWTAYQLAVGTLVRTDDGLKRAEGDPDFVEPSRRWRREWQAARRKVAA